MPTCSTGHSSIQRLASRGLRRGEEKRRTQMVNQRQMSADICLGQTTANCDQAQVDFSFHLFVLPWPLPVYVGSTTMIRNDDLGENVRHLGTGEGGQLDVPGFPRDSCTDPCEKRKIRQGPTVVSGARCVELSN